MNCPKCGNEIPDESSFCPQCGASLKNQVATKKMNNDLYTVAFIFMIIGTVVWALWTFFIGLAWTIPMTVHLSSCMKEGKKPSIAFSVCTLLFVSLVSGILLLIDSGDN